MDAEEIGIRMLTVDDAEALRHLAERDSAEVPLGRLIGATVDGRLVAAHSLASGESIADPFVPTEEIRFLLAGRAKQLRGEARGGRLSRLRRNRYASSSSSRLAT